MDYRIAIKTDSRIGQGLRKWWTDLENDRASRAALRRCATLTDVALCPAYQRFYRYMLGCGWPTDATPWEQDKLAAIAGLLAWVKLDSDMDLPYRMSELDGERPLVSELRFRALLKLDDLAELYGGLRRVLPLVGHQTNVIQLARDVWGWGDVIKKHWAYNYRWTAHS